MADQAPAHPRTRGFKANRTRVKNNLRTLMNDVPATLGQRDHFEEFDLNQVGRAIEEIEALTVTLQNGINKVEAANTAMSEHLIELEDDEAYDAFQEELDTENPELNRATIDVNELNAFKTRLINKRDRLAAPIVPAQAEGDHGAMQEMM